MNEIKISAPTDTSIDIFELSATIWRGKFLAIAIVIIAVAIAATYLHFATYKYTAELAVKPAQVSATSRPRAIGGLSDLASLAGVNMPMDQGSAQFQLYVEGLKSRVAADALSKNVDVMHNIFRTEWNEETRSWQEPKSTLRSMLQTIKPWLGVPNYPWQPPDGARLKEYMDSQVKVDQNPKQIIVTVTYKDRDPQFAVRFLAELNRVVDGKLRQDALLRSSTNVTYLSGMLRTITVAEHRQAITQALIDEEKSLMMANSSAPFAAELFGGPTTLSRPTDPDPVLTLAAAGLAGIVIGIASALMAARRHPKW